MPDCAKVFVMQVYLCQLDCVWEDRAATHRRAHDLITSAKPQSGSLIVLPETFSTGFSRNLEVTCQTDAAEDERFLAQMAKEWNCHVMGGVVNAAPGGKGYNQSVTFGPDGRAVARYSKLQPFMLGGEGECHVPGSSIEVFDLNGFKVAPLICYDLRFPEHARQATARGANLLVYIASWPVKRYHHWLTLLQARAIENLAFVIGVNRTGSDPEFHYNGRSVVVSPHGHIIADAGEQERVIRAEITPQEVEEWRAVFPALRDRREFVA
jgi:predicted amidohydrolase